MIRYDLICDKGHEFDGWFSDSDSFEKQARRGLVACSHCGSIRVEKQLMAPRLGARSTKKEGTGVSSSPSPSPSHAMMAGPADPRLQAMVKMVRDLRAHVEKTAENVGDRFAEEARKIHYGETEERGIYGSASRDEAQALIEEGIDVHPLPRLPEDGN
ncbi:MAG: DUF1178 family protein [Hyphomicrobiales bacterium]